MDTLKLFFVVLFSCCLSVATYAQKLKTETFNVSGECGTCKKKIEKAAMEAGASYALWNVDTKTLTVKYSSNSTNTAKIQQAVASTGYDTPDFKATDEAYEKFDDCCKYERQKTGAASVKDCCKKDRTKTMDCCKDGKCTKESKDCCKKDGATTMDCCNNGKCDKEGQDGKECCKKS